MGCFLACRLIGAYAETLFDAFAKRSVQPSVRGVGAPCGQANVARPLGSLRFHAAFESEPEEAS